MQTYSPVYSPGTSPAATRSRCAEIVSFHECSICGYTFLQHLTRDELASIAEPVPGGPSIRELERIARDHGTVIMAGLIEAGENDRFHNCYATVGPGGFITKFMQSFAEWIERIRAPG